MALKTTTAKDNKYLCILNKDGDVVAFVNPAKNIILEVLLTALQSKNINAEIRTKDDSVIDSITL